MRAESRGTIVVAEQTIALSARLRPRHENEVPRAEEFGERIVVELTHRGDLLRRFLGSPEVGAEISLHLTRAPREPRGLFEPLLDLLRRGAVGPRELERVSPRMKLAVGDRELPAEATLADSQEHRLEGVARGDESHRHLGSIGKQGRPAHQHLRGSEIGALQNQGALRGDQLSRLTLEEAVDRDDAAPRSVGDVEGHRRIEGIATEEKELSRRQAPGEPAAAIGLDDFAPL